MKKTATALSLLAACTSQADSIFFDHVGDRQSYSYAAGEDQSFYPLTWSRSFTITAPGTITSLSLTPLFSIVDADGRIREDSLNYSIAIGTGFQPNWLNINPLNGSFDYVLHNSTQTVFLGAFGNTPENIGFIEYRQQHLDVGQTITFGFYLDRVDFQPVPEPTTKQLILIGGFLVFVAWMSRRF